METYDLNYSEIITNSAMGITFYENCPEPLDFNAECRIFIMNVLWSRIIGAKHVKMTRDDHAFNVLLLHEMQEAIRPSIIDRGKFASALGPTIEALDKVIIDYFFADCKLSDAMVAEFYRLIFNQTWRNEHPKPSSRFCKALEENLMHIAKIYLPIKVRQKCK